MVVVVSSGCGGWLWCCGGCVYWQERQGRKYNYLNELRNKDFIGSVSLTGKVSNDWIRNLRFNHLSV